MMSIMNVPDVHEIIPHLWLGNRAISKNANFFKQKDISLVINCSKDIPNTFEKNPNIRYIRIPIDDYLQVEDFITLYKYMLPVIQIIHAYRIQKKNVLVHCFAGMQRSASVVAGYLMYYFQMDLPTAVHYIQSKRVIAFRPQINFLDTLIAFEKNVVGL
jgi:protein-tyrosine phosphatase